MAVFVYVSYVWKSDVSLTKDVSFEQLGNSVYCIWAMSEETELHKMYRLPKLSKHWQDKKSIWW